MNPEAILNCFICNHQFDWNKHQHCPNCNWKIKDFVGDIENTAVLLRPEREAWVAKKNYKITDFSYKGYVPALLEAMKKQFTLEDFDSNYSPSFFKDWDEDSDLFNARLSEKPIFLGVATWINKLYQPSTGHFPIEITWHSRIEDKNNKYYVIIDKSMAKTTFDATRNPEIYLTLHFDESKGIYAEQAFLIANQQIFEIQPVDSIQLLNIQGDDEASEQNQNAEAQDAEMQTQFKPNIIKPLPKPIISQQNDSIYSTYCDFMGRLYDRQYSSEDLNLLLNQDIRLKYLFGLSLEDILNEREPFVMNILANSQVAMNYVFKSFRLVELIAKSDLMMSKIIHSEIAMNEIVKSEVAMTFFITSNQNLVQFGSSDIAIQAIVNSDLAMNFVKNNINCFNALCQKISNVSIKKLTLKIIDFNPESFDHFDDVVNSSEAMNAVANSEIAMKAVANSEVAMKVVANSKIAMKAVTNSEIAMKAINASQTALDVLYQHAKKLTDCNWDTRQILSNKVLLVRISTQKSGTGYIKINDSIITTSQNLILGESSIEYQSNFLIDKCARLLTNSITVYSRCTFEFAYYELK